MTAGLRAALDKVGLLAWTAFPTSRSPGAPSPDAPLPGAPSE
jgi:hypothetical protein